MQTHKLMEVFVNNIRFHKTYFPGTGKLKNLSLFINESDDQNWYKYLCG